MDHEGRKFGTGPRELGGAVDLINRYKLWPHHEFFCKRSLPLSISQTPYLRNVVGDTEIRKGDGMEFDQLFQNIPFLSEKSVHIHPFDFNILREAFQMRETTPIYLPAAEKGISTAVVKLNGQSIDKERKHRKHKDSEKKKIKDYKKHKHCHKGEGDYHNRTSNGHYDSKKQNKKRRHEGNGDLSGIREHKKSQSENSLCQRLFGSLIPQYCATMFPALPDMHFQSPLVAWLPGVFRSNIAWLWLSACLRGSGKHAAGAI
ncbi:putative mediator of RNA polymerase II transcription subunit 19b [Morella rubra]|uniref:Putative mediator of RNA polymerase II transcription subunit 19b n=1 Tax=Morella rubra TaxID=262757 RepID=A0A6A1WC26_9ROSI|nr:putative mediator of RNA polymerase II transcription subunit 19b [Morella rubra]